MAIRRRKTRGDAGSGNRPWPHPRRAALMRHVWHDVLFAHWRVPREVIESLLPANLQLDTYKGHAWVGVTPFEISGLRFRGLPAIPRLSKFPEVNLRTYVTCDGLPGIFFISLDAGRAVAVAGARLAFYLPYHYAVMNLRRKGEVISFSSARISVRTLGAAFSASYWPIGPVFQPKSGTLEHWLVERYCFFTQGPDQKVWRGEIQHRPWRLYQAEGAITRNTLAEAAGIELPDEGPILHYSHRQDVAVWSVEEEKSISGPRNPYAGGRAERVGR